jgi:Flp pilus assembly protein TadD
VFRKSRQGGLLAIVFVVSSLYIPGAVAASDSPEFRDAVAALQRGDLATAELKIQAELKLRPTEAEALSLLGVVLDNQKKFEEAEQNHKLAMANSPNSAGILNNYGNHLLFTGNPQGAREVFLSAVAIEPGDDYANVQLAQLALKANHGREALGYLDHVSAQQAEAPNIAIFRLIALDQIGSRPEASALFEHLTSATGNNAQLSTALGRTLAQAGQFEQAETFLTNALAADPANFGLLNQLGLIASHAGHNERAREVFEKALRQQPQNVEVLYSLAFVYKSLKQSEAAVRLLAQAAKLAPQRADIQRLLAVTAGDIQAYDDSVAAWDRYVALAPDDDIGRRERGFARAHIKQPNGIADLEWYVERHPNDATGLWELGVAQGVDDPEKALATLNKAVAIEPEFVEARSARGALNYQQGRADAALSDLEFAASKQPNNPLVLDRLGQTYLLVDRVADALRVLRRAAELAPDNARTQLHVANALGVAGQTEESHKFMQRYKELGGGANVMARGVMDYLSLTPEQQHADYRSRVEKGVRDHPDDVATQVLYLKLSIADGQFDKADATALQILALKPGASVLADSGRAMLAANRYAPARQLLEHAAAAAPDMDLNPELAVIDLHTDGPAVGLKRLERVPDADRGGDYYRIKARMLEASARPDEAIAAMLMGLKSEPTRPDLYWETAVLMTANHRMEEALSLLDRAAGAIPQEAQIPAIKAAMLEVAGKTEDAERLLGDAQRRWPEDAAVWAAQGIISAAHSRNEAARKCLETAVTLGAHSAEVYYALAATLIRTMPEHLDAAESAIGQALKVAPDDAGVQALASRIKAAGQSNKPVDPAGLPDDSSLPAKLFLARPPKEW